jgi:ABC-type branched-subunit amino acid transport system substrate-binding protein
MKQVVALLLVALALVIAFAVLTGGEGNEPDPLPPITNATTYHGTIGVILPNDSVIGDQVRNGIDTAYLLQDAKTRPSLVYLNGTDFTSLPALDAVITATDEISEAWDTSAGTSGTVHVAVASPGYAAIAPSDVITFSTPPYYEVSSLRSLLRQHETIRVLGPDNSYTAAYISDLEDATGSRIISGVFSSSSEEVASLRSLLARNPGLLIITGGEDIPALVAKAREFGLPGPVMVSSWIGEDAAVVNDSRMEGVYTAKRMSDISSHPFYNVYQARFGMIGSVYAAEGYDAVMTLSWLVPQSNGSTQYVAGWYMGKNYEGAAGSYEFDDEGCGRILMQIAQFQSGEVVPVDTYVRPPSEVIIGVYGNAEVVRGAAAGAELINSADSLSLPGASTSGISGLYGAKVHILPLLPGSPVPDNVTAVVGDLTGVFTNRPAVQTVSGGRAPEEGWSVSLAPDEDAGFSSLLDIVDGRRGYGPALDNVTVLYPENTLLFSGMISVLEDHGYRVSQVSYPLPLTETAAVAVMSGLNCSGQVLVSLPDSAEDLTVLLAGSRQTGSIPAVWYVAGDVIFGDPVLVQNTLVYDYLTGSDIWSSELGRSKPLVRDVSLFYSKVHPGRSMTGVSARSFEAVVMLADAMSVSGSTTPSAVGSALKNLQYSSDQSIFFGDGISFDGSGNAVGPKTVSLQIQSGSTRVLFGSADLGLVTDRQF